MEATEVWSAFSAAHPVTARSRVTTRSKTNGSNGAVGYTTQKTNTGTGAFRVWVNNRSAMQYQADVEAAAGADKAAKEAANTVGWVVLESVASVASTAADPETHTIEVPAPMKFERCRLEFVSTAGTSVITARVSSS